MANFDVTDDKIVCMIQELIRESGGAKDTFEAELVAQQIQTCLRFLTEGHHAGQLKLIARTLKEMRYAYRIFDKYPEAHRVSIFGSARTPEDHADYRAAGRFSKAMAEEGWMCMTGGVQGIMKAGMDGGEPHQSVGLSIQLPFEEPTAKFVEGDPELIHFKYFFTRKLMFMSHSDAIAVFPGGYGSLDELFEMLTLIQTGKSNIMPIVLMEGGGGIYWHHWENYVEKNLLENGWISPEDCRLYYIAPSVEEGVKHVLQFYRRYHSSRYVKDDFVIRLSSPLSEEQVDALNQQFSSLVQAGSIKQCAALPEEDDHLELPRLAFHHTRKDFGLLRMLIDQINAW